MTEETETVETETTTEGTETTSETTETTTTETSPPVLDYDARAAFTAEIKTEAQALATKITAEEVITGLFPDGLTAGLNRLANQIKFISKNL